MLERNEQFLNMPRHYSCSLKCACHNGSNEKHVSELEWAAYAVKV